MRIVNVKVSTPYDVLIGSDIMSKVGEYIGKHKKDCKVVIVSDYNSDKLFGRVISDSLEENGFSVLKYSFPPGEKSKNLNTVTEIMNFLAINKISKSDLLIALGGGVVGDITGFCASIYLRGIQFVQIPTTILSSVDSSVGGKTGVDLESGKNLVGTFCHPLLVICDINTFNTLDTEIYKDGLCEVIKYGCILDGELFNLLLEDDFSRNAEKIVEICIKLKADIVSQDEFDKGIRQILNYGHTIGHAIESLSEYTISHGKAVAIGMHMIEKASGSKLHLIIGEILRKYGIENETVYNAHQIAQKAKSDKKISGGSINLILLEDIGKAKIVALPIEELEDFISQGE